MEIWEPDPEKPGYLRFVRMKTLQEVFSELKTRLEADNLLPDEYFSISPDYRYLERYRGKKYDKIPLPENYWRVISFAAKGTSEGHYIHVGVITRDGEYLDLFLGKTFRGLGFALEVANACTRCFHG
ncbi:MAG: hypothetical protein ACPLRU_02080 [Desulfofundulus sp.]